MKTKVKRFSKRSLAVFLGVLMLLTSLGIGTMIVANAYGVQGNHRVYFINTNNWSTVYQHFWGDNNYHGYQQMTQISGTGVYSKWYDNDYTANGFNFNNAQSSSGGTSAFYDWVTSDTVYWPNSANHDSIGSVMNGTAKVKTRIDTGDGSYDLEANSDCVATISSKNIPGGYSTTTDTSGSTGSDSTAECYPAYGASVSYSASNGTQYTFMGFSTTSSTSLPNNATTSYSNRTSVGYNGSNNLSDVYAYFKKTTYYLRGIINDVNCWGNNNYQFSTTDGTTYSVQATLRANEEMKIYDGTGNAWWGHTNSGYNLSTSENGSTLQSPGKNFKAPGAGVYTIYWVPSTNKAWAVATGPNYYVASGGSSLTGNSWDEDDPDGEMTLSSGTTYSKVFNISSLASDTTYQFRITDGSDDGWITGSSNTSVTGNVEPTLDGDNVKFTLGASETGYKVTVTFNSEQVSSKYPITVNAKEISEEESGGASVWPPEDIDISSATASNDYIRYINSSSSNDFAQLDPDSSNGISFKHPVRNNSAGYWWFDMYDSSDATVGFGNLKTMLSGSNNIYYSIVNDRDYTGNQWDSHNWRSNQEPELKLNDTGIDSGSTNKDGSKYFVGLYSIPANATHVGVKIQDNGSKFIYTYYVSTSSSTVNTLNIIAKDGMLRSDNGGFADTATTSIVTASNGNTDYTNGATDGVYDTDGYLFTMGDKTVVATGREYKNATLKIKKDEDVKYTLHIKTAISSTYNTRYYVKGWCVNGKTYGYRDSDTVTADGNYYCDIDVTYADFAATNGELYENGKIEITPIYYTTQQSKCIGFRVENFNEEVQQADWGKTLYAYPFYGDLANVKNSYGSYPGQPMVYYNGKYSIQIPIESIAINTADIRDDGVSIRGITLNNGWEDSVHRTACGWADNDRTKHKQTYDFDDFFKIYSEKNANDIIFRFKYRSTDKSYNHDNYFQSGKTTLSSDVNSTSEKANDKGWELLRDRAGRVIDIFGNPIKNTSTNEYITSTTATAANPSDLRTQSGQEPVRVVSMGYFDNCSGEYATEWVVFSRGTSSSGDYTRLQYDSSKYSIVPSALLMNSADRMDTYKIYRNKPTNYYKDIYNALNTTSAAKGKPAFISYEKDQVRSDNAVRCDGRWYYTTSSDYVKSRIKIQYKSASGKWIDDTYATSADTDITGVTTGGKAYFTNEAYENKKVSNSEIYSSEKSDNYKFTAKSGTNYQFAGWYFEYDEDTDNPTFKQITTDTAGEAARTSSDLLVARYVPVKSGEVFVSHEIGSDENYPGTGTTEAKVEVLNGSGTVVKTYAYTTDNIKVGSTYIKETNTGYKLRITLKTTPGTDNTFQKFGAEATTSTYSTGQNWNTVYATASAQESSSITVNVSDIIDHDISTLQYFSYLTKMTHKYDITYTYTSTRLKHDMSFRKVGTFSETSYSNNVTILASGLSGGASVRKVSTAFISSVAPHESNFKEILSIARDECVTTESFETSGSVVTHTITVKFDTTDDKEITGVFHLPYKYTKGAGADSNTGAYAAKEDYKDYRNVDEYYVAGSTEEGYGSTGTSIPTSSDGVLIDGSTEAFNVFTTYGGHFTTNDIKIYLTLDAIKNDKQNIITAPKTVLNSEVKHVTKKTIYMSGNTKLTWAALGSESSADYIAEMKRIAGIENMVYDDLTSAQKTALKNKYTYTLNNVAYRCYRVEVETKYVPTNEVLTFAYWKIENAEREEVARCYNQDFTYLAFENYHITPIYMNSDELADFNKDNPITSISYMDQTRNQWNNGGGNGASNLVAASDSNAGDYIFVDFATSFDYQDKILKNYDGVSEVGVLVQRAGAAVDGVTSSSGYKKLYKDGETENTSAVLQDVVNNATTTGKYTATTGKKFQKIAINKSNLNNKNRLDYVLTVSNSYGWTGDFETGYGTNKDTVYSGNAFRVYSYIIVDGKIAISPNPAYFCTIGIANS